MIKWTRTKVAVAKKEPISPIFKSVEMTLWRAVEEVFPRPDEWPGKGRITVLEELLPRDDNGPVSKKKNTRYGIRRPAPTYG